MNTRHAQTGQVPNPAQQAPVHRAQQLLHSLTEDRADLMAMSALLDKEKLILDSGEHAHLETTASEKIKLANQLDARHKLRAQLLPKLKSANAQTQAESGNVWRQQLELLEKQSGVGLSQAWQEIEALLKQSDEKLRINEKIVSSLQGNVNRFINQLREQNGDGKTYNAAGEAKSFANGQPLGSA